MNRDTFILGRFDRNLADVERWAIVRTIRRQSVAEHSYFVAMMMPRLLREYGFGHRPEMIADAIEYALLHDRDEVLSGDIATPIKKRMDLSPLKEMAQTFGVVAVCPEPLVETATKVLDLFEAAVFLNEEIALGNARVGDVLYVIQRKLAKWCEEFEKHVEYPPPDGRSLYKRLTETLHFVRHGRVDPLEEAE